MKEYEKIPFVFEWERILGCQKVKNEFYLLQRVLSDLKRTRLPGTYRKTEKDRQLTDGRRWGGVGEEPNHTTAKSQTMD